MYLCQRLPPCPIPLKSTISWGPHWDGSCHRRWLKESAKKWKNCLLCFYAGSFRHFLRKCHLPPGGRLVKWTRLRVAGKNCMADRPNKRRTCASPVVFRAMPDNEIPTFYGGDIYFGINRYLWAFVKINAPVVNIFRSLQITEAWCIMVLFL